MSPKPCLFSSSMMCSMSGLLTTGTMGFGRLLVSGRRRVPCPPAITTVWMSTASLSAMLTTLFRLLGGLRRRVLWGAALLLLLEQRRNARNVYAHGGQGPEHPDNEQPEAPGLPGVERAEVEPREPHPARAGRNGEDQAADSREESRGRDLARPVYGHLGGVDLPDERISCRHQYVPAQDDDEEQQGQHVQAI